MTHGMPASAAVSRCFQSAPPLVFRCLHSQNCVARCSTVLLSQPIVCMQAMLIGAKIQPSHRACKVQALARAHIMRLTIAVGTAINGRRQTMWRHGSEVRSTAAACVSSHIVRRACIFCLSTLFTLNSSQSYLCICVGNNMRNRKPFICMQMQTQSSRSRAGAAARMRQKSHHTILRTRSRTTITVVVSQRGHSWVAAAAAAAAAPCKEAVF